MLTKPDCLGTGNLRQKQLWLEVIEGDRHPLAHGYFCTRQPDDDDRARGITFDEARTAELEFFTRERPWCDSKQRDRFGTAKLSARLSELLMKIINDGHVCSRVKSDYS